MQDGSLELARVHAKPLSHEFAHFDVAPGNLDLRFHIEDTRPVRAEPIDLSDDDELLGPTRSENRELDLDARAQASPADQLLDGRGFAFARAAEEREEDRLRDRALAGFIRPFDADDPSVGQI